MKRPCSACGGHAWSPDDPDGCPACSGRGWQPVYMPVSDALADAETLRLHSDKADNLEWAARMGTDAVRRARLGYETTAPDRARKAARNAFRAVPELRGE